MPRSTPRIPPTAFAAWLQSQLIRKRINAQRLAAQLKVDPHRVSEWRYGVLPGPTMCLKLANLLEVPLAVVYAYAQIPIRATWETPQDAWEQVPDLATDPLSLALFFLQQSGHPRMQEVIALISS